MYEMASPGKRGGWLPDRHFDVALKVLRASKEALLFQPRLPVQHHGERRGATAVGRGDQQEALAIRRDVPAVGDRRWRGEQPMRGPRLESVGGIYVNRHSIEAVLGCIQHCLPSARQRGKTPLPFEMSHLAPEAPAPASGENGRT